MSHFLLALGTFVAVFIAAQLSVLAATVVVHLFFPEWESAKRRLRLINQRSTHYALVGARLVEKYFVWVLLCVLTLITVAYS